jgi:hypothetical protein
LWCSVADGLVQRLTERILYSRHSSGSKTILAHLPLLMVSHHHNLIIPTIAAPDSLTPNLDPDSDPDFDDLICKHKFFPFKNSAKHEIYNFFIFSAFFCLSGSGSIELTETGPIHDPYPEL